MKNKMSESRNTLGGGAFSSHLNSRLLQKISSIHFFVPLNPFKIKDIKAFSIAEAMIALLIGTIILGFSAPIISRQLKNETFTNTQMQILQKQIDEIRRIAQTVPAGAVMFFNLDTCPDGWDPINNEWNGRFPRFAGEHLIKTYDTDTKRFKTTGLLENLNVGTIQEDAIRNFSGTITDIHKPDSFSGVFSGGEAYCGWGHVSGCSYRTDLTIEAQKSVPTDTENRPKAIALLGCVKKPN